MKMQRPAGIKSVANTLMETPGPWGSSKLSLSEKAIESSSTKLNDSEIKFDHTQLNIKHDIFIAKHYHNHHTSYGFVAVHIILVVI